MKRRIRTAAALAATLCVASCGLFGDKEEELEPKALEDIEARIAVREVWSARIGGDADKLRVALRPASDGSRLYAASADGNVVALDLDSGKTLWKSELDLTLSAGPATGAGVVAVASRDGSVILLDASTGNEEWRVDVGGESLARPLLRDDAVIVQTIDNRLRSLSRFDGKQRWYIEQSMPALTMRGGASPLLVGNSVIAGFDNGRLLAVDAETGDIEWEALLALPTGRSDLDRLSDVDGSIAVVGQDLYAAGYQGRVASVAAESGQVLWQREITTHTGVAADWNNVFTTATDGEVIAMSRNAGTEQWRSDALLRRDPTLPAPFRNTAVVGDFEGFVHFFSTFDGGIAARTRFGKAAISASPVVVGNRVYVQSDNGSVGAFEIVDDTPQRAAPDIADES